MHLFLKFILGKKLYMFRTVSLSIIRMMDNMFYNFNYTVHVHTLVISAHL